MASIGGAYFYAPESVNRVWRPLSPFLMFGWKTSVWIIELLFLFTFVFTLYTVFRTLRAIPLLFMIYYFATAPFQADQDIFIRYISIVTEAVDSLWNCIFRPIMNGLISCIRHVCCLYNFLINVLRSNTKLFLDFFRGLIIENMPSVLESTFGIPASDVQEIMDYLDLTLPPGFVCDASSGPTDAYIQCVLDELEMSQPSIDVLDCRGFIKYKQTMAQHYGVPYDVLIDAHKRDGMLTTDGVMKSYIKLNHTKVNVLSDEFGDVDDNEWGAYRVRSTKTSRNIRTGTYSMNARENELREVRTHVEEAMGTLAKYVLKDEVVPRNVCSFFPGFENVDEYEVAVLEVMCSYFNDYFDDFWQILLGIFFTVYDIAWNFIQYLLDFGLNDFNDFFSFLLDYLLHVLLQIPCLEFSSAEDFAVSLLNCPCQLFADELGFTYYPAVGNDSDTYLAAAFSCVGFDCAVDPSGTATLERFYSNCIVQNFLDLMCANSDDCPSGFSCQSKIFIDNVGFDADDGSISLDFLGWCLPTSKRSIMVRVYTEKVRMEKELGATSFGAADNSSVEYWDMMMDTAHERYPKRNIPVPNTLGELIDIEFNETMDREGFLWMKRYSPNKKYWSDLYFKNKQDFANEKIQFGTSTTYNKYATINTFANKVDLSPWKRFTLMVAQQNFDRWDKKAMQIGPAVHTIDWDTHYLDGSLKSRNGVQVTTRNAHDIVEGDDDYITPSQGIEEGTHYIGFSNGLNGDEGMSMAYTHLQLILRSLTDVVADNLNVFSTVEWDPVEYSFITPSPRDLRYMFERMNTKEKIGAAWRHLVEGSKEQKEMLSDKGLEEPSMMVEFAVTIKLMVTRFMAPTLLGKVSKELESRSSTYAAAVKRILPTYTEGNDVDKLMTEINLGNTDIWDIHRYKKHLRKQELNMLKNNTYAWAMKQRKKALGGDSERMATFMQYPPVNSRILELGREPVAFQRAVSERLPQVAAVFSLVLPILQNPKLIASGLAPFLTNRFSMVIIRNILYTMAKPLEHMYTQGLVNTLGDPSQLQQFGEDFSMTIVNNMVFLLEEGARLLLCNWWAIVMNAVSGLLGVILYYIPYVNMAWVVILGFVNALGSGVLIMVAYCPPKPVLDNYMPVDLPWNYLFNLIDCDPETMCKTASDCISNAPCRCAPTAQYESFFWAFNGDRDGPACEDGGGMATGYCLCWPNLPCDFEFPELQLEKAFSGDCVKDFGYKSSGVATWQTPGFSTWFRTMTINWYRGSQFITRCISQGRKRFLSDSLGFSLMTISLGIAAIALNTRWWIIILLAWLTIMFVWDLWHNILVKFVVPKVDSLTSTVIAGPILSFFLRWIRFPNYSAAMPIGNLRDGEFTCWVFNTPAQAMSTGGGISLAAIIYALWVAGTVYVLLQYILYILMMLPTAIYYGAQASSNQDEDIAALEQELAGMEGADDLGAFGGEEDLTEYGGFPPLPTEYGSSNISAARNDERPSSYYIGDPSEGPVVYYVLEHEKGE